jgi:hypothetical protein
LIAAEIYIIIVMSLPRIKTLHEAEGRNISSSKDLKVKFRKIALD